ncbi:WD40-repeat-containing domain protein [Blakeslea trispora]|nr:WD40-repeat-containing domain protein [Blakeslea trispora]
MSWLILSFCDKKTILEFSSVCKYWHHLCKDNYLWRQLYFHHYGKTAHQTKGVIHYKHLYQKKAQLVERWYSTEVYAQMKTILGHADSIYCLQFDATKMITGSRDRTVKIWDSHGQCLKTLVGHRASVLCLQYDQDLLVTGSSDHTLLVWSMHTLQILFCLKAHTSGVLDVCFDQRHIVSCSKDATICIWNRETGKLERTLRGHRGPVNAVQFHDKRLVSASGDTIIKLWDMETGQCLRDFVGHAHGLACVQFDGKKIVSGSNDNKIKVWNAGKANDRIKISSILTPSILDTGECLLTCTGHTGLVRSLYFDKTKIVSGSYDQSIRVWDIHTGECIKTFSRCHTSWVFDVMFDETRIISTSQDQKILIIDFAYDMNDIKHFLA